MFYRDTGATVLVGQFDRLKLYCSYPSVTESLDNPSLYCIVSGNTFSLLKTKISTHVYMHIHSISVNYHLVQNRLKNRCYVHYRLCRLHPLAGKSYRRSMVLIQIQAGLNRRAKQC